MTDNEMNPLDNYRFSIGNDLKFRTGYTHGNREVGREPWTSI